MTLTIEVDLPNDFRQFRLPKAAATRLKELLDHQNHGIQLTLMEKEEAEELVDLAELLTLLKLQAERVSE